MRTHQREVKKNAGKRKSKSNAYNDFRFIYTKARHGLGEVIRSTSEKFRQELKRDWTVVQRTPHLIRLRSAQAEQVNDRQPRGASPGVVGRPHRDRGAVTASASNRCFRPFSLASGRLLNIGLALVPPKQMFDQRVFPVGLPVFEYFLGKRKSVMAHLQA